MDLEKIERLINQEINYRQRYVLKYYLWEAHNVDEDERDRIEEGVVEGLQLALKLIKESKKYGTQANRTPSPSAAEMVSVS